MPIRKGLGVPLPAAPGVFIIENGNVPDTITVTIPATNSAKLFVHLKVVIAGE